MLLDVLLIAFAGWLLWVSYRMIREEGSWDSVFMPLALVAGIVIWLLLR